MRDRPWQSLALVAVALTVVYAAIVAVVAPSTSLGGFVLVLAVSLLAGAVLTGRRRTLAVLALVAGATAVGRASAGSDDGGAVSAFLVPIVIVLAPALAGALVGHARRQAARLRLVTSELTAEREAHAASAAAEERNRIARELHDVISHSVSQMVVQAGAAEQLLAADDPVRATLQVVRTTGRQALTELREQLGVLRDGPDAVPAPVPALADLRGLAGGDVALEYDDATVGHVPPGPALTAYRVVQEALTNARRHAHGAPVRVRIGREDDRLAVDVVNGPGRPHADASLDARVMGPGHGLTGMRERLDLYAGELEAGRTDDGGWRVRARLPLGAPA